MTDADRISQWASVPYPLAELAVFGALLFGLPLKDVRSDSRRQPLVRCRSWIARQARREGYSFPQIGRAINRDHSTVMYAISGDQSVSAHPIASGNAIEQGVNKQAERYAA